MAERYFSVEESRLYVDLDTVTLCRGWGEGHGWTVDTANNRGFFIDDDATGAALFAALCVWRKEHPAPEPPPPTTPYPQVHPEPMIPPTDLGPSDWPPAPPVYSEPHTGDPLLRQPRATWPAPVTPKIGG